MRCHVVVADVAAVFAQVDGDAVGAGGDRRLGGVQRVGMGAAAGVAHRGDVIDVHAEALWDHRGLLSWAARRSARVAARVMAAIRLVGSAMPLPAMS